VLVQTRDGRSLRHHALHVRGTPDNAMERSEVVEKAIDLIQPILADRSSALIAALLEVETVPDMRKLGSLLQSNKSG